jgi:hypothetical protein
MLCSKADCESVKENKNQSVRILESTEKPNSSPRRHEEREEDHDRTKEFKVHLENDPDPKLES